MPKIIGIPEEKRPYCKLAGEDGNAYAIMGRVSDALKRAGLTEEAKAYRAEATAGDYDHLLQVSLVYVKDGSAASDEDDACVECGEPSGGEELCEACEDYVSEEEDD